MQDNNIYYYILIYIKNKMDINRYRNPNDYKYMDELRRIQREPGYNGYGYKTGNSWLPNWFGDKNRYMSNGNGYNGYKTGNGWLPNWFGDKNRYMSNGTSIGSTSISKQIMNSDSAIVRISFLLLVIFIFIVLFKFLLSLIIKIINYMNNSPHLIDGMVQGNQMVIIPQDPASKGAKTIYRSINGESGIEFTWSVWVYIDDLVYQKGVYKHIFSKGDNLVGTGTTGSQNLNFPNNAPGLYIAPNTNALVVVMNTFDNINEEIDITDIPLNKWLNVIIRCKETNLDVYINGEITKSLTLESVPKQNYGDVYVAMNGGFSGYISNLWYYNYALSIYDINSIIKKGPNLKISNSDNSALSFKGSNYLSTSWFFNEG